MSEIVDHIPIQSNSSTRRKIYSVESHEQVLGIWRRNKTRNAKVLHVDFHCDLRGLLIDRKAQTAYRIWDRFPQLDEGNFLTHAVLEGIVREVRWVHDEPGGRKDDLKTVKYATDSSALIHRLLLALRHNHGIPIGYDVVPTDMWSGINEGEILDVDWDYFASTVYPSHSIQRRIDSFLSNDFKRVPEQTFVCYSPEYSHPTRSQFDRFVRELAARFEAEVVTVPRPVKSKSSSLIKPILNSMYRPARHVYHSTCLALRKRGIY